MKKPFYLCSLALSIITITTLLTNCASDSKHTAHQANHTNNEPNNPEMAAAPEEIMAMHEQMFDSNVRQQTQKVKKAEAMSLSAYPTNQTMIDDQYYPRPHPVEPSIVAPLSVTIADNPTQSLKRTKEEPVSTFSVDVDTASFSQVKQYLDRGQLPPKDLVRTEEIINYFNYHYHSPQSLDNPIALNSNLMAHPFKSNAHLLQLGLKAYEVEAKQLPPMNLVLLIDVSGSMGNQDKLPLLIRGMDVLIDQLDEDDRVSIVTYAGRAATLAKGVAGNQKQTLRRILSSLKSGGSTHGSAGIEQAYNLAKQFHIQDGVNRVVLATDGDFNVGLTGTDSLKEFVSKQANDAIYLSAIGFGHTGYNDAIMEEISNAGEGNAYFINNYNQARKVFANDLPSMALSVAADVKVQVEFNPKHVLEYRLIGYNNRRLNREDFNNDNIDAAEMGAGHNVTALYEVVLVGDTPNIDPLRYQSHIKPIQLGHDIHAEIAFFKARYKKQLNQTSEKITLPIYNEQTKHLSDSLLLATAAMQFGENLRNIQSTRSDYQEILTLLNNIKKPNNEVEELSDMIHTAKSLITL